jgi:hypothetical protein
MGGRVNMLRQYGRFRNQKDTLTYEVFGGKCNLCDTTKGNPCHYHLHHLVYVGDYHYPRNTKFQWTREQRVKEATAHPERFMLLCESCHRAITRSGSYFLTRLQPLQPEARQLMLAEIKAILYGEAFETSKYTDSLVKYVQQVCDRKTDPDYPLVELKKLIYLEVTNRLPEVDNYY